MALVVALLLTAAVFFFGFDAFRTRALLPLGLALFAAAFAIPAWAAVL